jgi:hypothetical protein
MCDICGMNFKKTPYTQLCGGCQEYLIDNKKYISHGQLEKIKLYHTIYNYNCHDNPMRISLKMIIHNLDLVIIPKWYTADIEDYEIEDYEIFGGDPRREIICNLCQYRYGMLTEEPIKNSSADDMHMYECKTNLNLVDLFDGQKEPFGDEYHLCQKHYIKMIKVSADNFVDVKLIINFFNKCFGEDIANEIFMF